MINETMELDKNRFWFPINASTNNTPYAEGYIRCRTAFDGRLVNEHCDLIQAKMPTMHNFDDFFSQRGLITIADFKNYFDCIPLDKRDLKKLKYYDFQNMRLETACVTITSIIKFN